MAAPPKLPLQLLALTLPRAERDELLADVHAEYGAIAAAKGTREANAWLNRQAIASIPALLKLNWLRASTGFEPRANAFTPGVPHMQHWIADVRFAARRLRRRPAYTLLAVLTLALGIGGTAAIFGIARPILLDPLPYGNTDQVVSFWRPGWWNEEEYTYMRDKFPGFTAVAMHRPYDVIMRTDDGQTRLIPGINSSYELFDVLGARPLLGRTFQKGEDVPGVDPVAILSYGLWQELGGTPDVVGKRFDFDGLQRTVVGVMPKEFWYPSPSVRLWTARQIQPAGRNGSYTFVGKVAPGVDPTNMKPQIDAFIKVLTERFTYGTNGDNMQNPWIKPLREVLVGGMKPAVYATFAAMALILIIACANVAALMLGQVEGRAGELAVRTALGATQTRIAQQIVVEALLIGALAGIVGAGLAAVGFSTLARALPLGGWSDAAAFDWTAFAAALALALVAVLAVALVPTTSLWRGGLRGAITGARMGGVTGRGGRLEGGLVVAEVALAMLVASGAALLLRSVSKLYDIRPGVETAGIGVVDVATNRTMNANVRVEALDRVIAALEQQPGVRSVAAGMKIPLRGGGDSFGVYEEGTSSAGPDRIFSYFRIVTPRYFETMGVRIAAGRNFDESDRAFTFPTSDTMLVMSVVVNETFAKKMFPGRDAVGRRFRGGFGIPQQIIGVVPDIAEASLTDKPEGAAYYIHRQAWFGNYGSFVVRTTRPQDAPAILSEARRTVQRAAPDFAVRSVTTMQSIHDIAVGPARQLMTLLGLLAGLALLLGAIGIYGVIAHFATRRKRDWAIRIALGLTGGRVVTHIVRQGMLLATIGVVIGALGAALGTRLLKTFMYNVSSLDALAFAAATMSLLAIGAIAAFVPAWRAGKVDPAIVLREQ